MGNSFDEIIKGRKTFFIAPDRSLIPQSYLEEYLSRDYECYFVDNDHHLSIEKKVESILSLFEDPILFFNIDSPINGFKWANYIQSLTNTHKNLCVGVLYSKRQNQLEKTALEQLYLYYIGVQGGCIQLEYQKRNNFSIIEKTLYANQAMGRRRSVRALCRGNCSFEIITKDNIVVTGKINDISVSHFSFTIDEETEEALGLSDYEKVKNIAFYVNGLHFRSDAILIMRRRLEKETLYVFSFVDKDGKGGLDAINRQNLIPKLYEILNTNTDLLLDKVYKYASGASLSEIRNNIDQALLDDVEVS